MKRAPKHGTVVTCPDGRQGTVVSVTPLSEKVRVRVGDDENFEFCEFDLNELVGERREQKQNQAVPADKQNNDRQNGGDGKNKPAGRGEKHKPNNNQNQNGNGRKNDRDQNRNNKVGGNAEYTAEPQDGKQPHGGKKNKHRRFNHKKKNQKPQSE